MATTFCWYLEIKYLDGKLHECIPDLLQQIPASINIQILLSILDEFRKSLQSIPKPDTKTLRILDQWVYNTAETIEQIYNNPKDALTLLEWTLNVSREFEVEDTSTPTSQINFLTRLSHFRSYQQSNLVKAIQDRIIKLQDILRLEHTHDFKMSLLEYEQNSAVQIAMMMLERVHAPELLAKNITNHVSVFCKHHKIQLNELLTDYCKDMMESSCACAIWEPRMLAIQDLINDPSLKTSLLLEATRRTRIPWSKALNDSIEVVLGLTTSLREELYEQFKLLKLKRMVLGYGIKTFNVSDINLAGRLVPFILRHVDVVGAVDDALQCVDAYQNLPRHQVYVTRAQFLVSAGLLDRFERLITFGKEVDDAVCKPEFLGSDELYSVLQELNIWNIMKLDLLITKGICC